MFIVGLNTMARVTADTLLVTARNPAPIPTSPAIILNPEDGTTIHNGDVTVYGSCPTIVPRVIIAIVDNGTEVGSVACDVNNEFSLPVHLGYGPHTIIARTYTITDDRGPDSDPVHVNYPAPPTPITPITVAPQQTSSHSRSNATEPRTNGTTHMTLRNMRTFLVYGPTKDALWVGSIHGGIAPYKLVIHWGDGRQDTLILPDSNDQSISHHYDMTVPYDVTLNASDESGQHVVWHMAAVSPFISPLIPSFTTPLDWRPYIGLYGTYLLLLAVFGYLWMRAHAFAYAKVPNRRRTYATTNHHKRASHAKAH